MLACSTRPVRSASDSFEAIDIIPVSGRKMKTREIAQTSATKTAQPISRATRTVRRRPRSTSSTLCWSTSTKTYPIDEPGKDSGSATTRWPFGSCILTGWFFRLKASMICWLSLTSAPSDWASGRPSDPRTMIALTSRSD